MRISDAISQPLTQLYSLNEKTEALLRGGAYAMTVERIDGGFPWVQAKTNVLNIFFPETSDPLVRLRGCLPSLPAEFNCPDWQAEKFATLEFASITALDLGQVIEDLFVHFYDLPAETEVSIEIFDMR